MLTNLIKPYGILYLTEDQVDSILLIFPLMNGPTRIIIGWLCDVYGFKKIYYSMLFVTVNKLINLLIF
jgi:nitrate/nitrite transporter NarK